MRWAIIALAACGSDPKPVAKPPEPVKPVTAPLVTPTTLTPDVVLAKIRGSYMGGVKRCYSVLLKNRSTARGTVMITFTVDAEGRVQHGEAKGFVDSVNDCITAQVADWRFPIPKDQAGAPAEASFALPLELQPD